MGQSRKKRSRGEIRRRRQLREENERIASSQKQKYVKEGVSLRQLLKKYTVELVLITFMALSVVFIMSLGPDKKGSPRAEGVL